jgi:hypothetical protein
MFDRSLRVRRFVALGAAVAATAVAAPLATADPAPLFIPHTQHAFPRLGEGLTGADRAWLGPRPDSPSVGDRLTGADRSWLVPTSNVGQVAVPSTGFHWGDAGIGAAAAATVLGILGSVVAFRKRVSAAH